jgi:hypothetical protein
MRGPGVTHLALVEALQLAHAPESPMGPSMRGKYVQLPRSADVTAQSSSLLRAGPVCSRTHGWSSPTQAVTIPGRSDSGRAGRTRTSRALSRLRRAVRRRAPIAPTGGRSRPIRPCSVEPSGSRSTRPRRSRSRAATTPRRRLRHRPVPASPSPPPTARRGRPGAVPGRARRAHGAPGAASPRR